jgi:hypothetical protein
LLGANRVNDERGTEANYIAAEDEARKLKKGIWK